MSMLAPHWYQNRFWGKHRQQQTDNLKQSGELLFITTKGKNGDMLRWESRESEFLTKRSINNPRSLCEHLCKLSSTGLWWRQRMKTAITRTLLSMLIPHRQQCPDEDSFLPSCFWWYHGVPSPPPNIGRILKMREWTTLWTLSMIRGECSQYGPTAHLHHYR